MPPSTRRDVLRLSITAFGVAVAGCSLASGPEQTDTETHPSASPTPSESPIPSENITTYESLSEQGKGLFRTISEEGAVERPIDRFPSRLWEAEYVRYNGEIYAISKTDTGQFIAEYTVTVHSVNEADVDESELISYKDLSQDAKDAFTQALNQGRYTSRDERLPGKLGDVRFVKRDDEYYKLRITVGDIRVWKLSTTNLSE